MYASVSELVILLVEELHYGISIFIEPADTDIVPAGTNLFTQCIDGFYTSVFTCRHCRYDI